MKKNIEKVSSFFTEKRSTIIFLLLVLSVLLFPKNTYALSVADWTTQKYTDDFTAKIEPYFKFKGVAYITTNNTPSDSTLILYCLFVDNVDYIINSSTGYIQYKDSNNNWQNLKCLNSTTQQVNGNNGFDMFIGFSTQSQSLLGINAKKFKSSIDLYDQNNTLIKTANISYTPPSSGGQEECEVCQECEEGGPVEVSNFPIDKTEFYVLLVMLSTLILMLFFKWCFPMKGGKNK